MPFEAAKAWVRLETSETRVRHNGTVQAELIKEKERWSTATSRSVTVARGNYEPYLKLSQGLFPFPPFIPSLPHSPPSFSSVFPSTVLPVELIFFLSFLNRSFFISFVQVAGRPSQPFSLHSLRSQLCSIDSQHGRPSSCNCRSDGSVGNCACHGTSTADADEGVSIWRLFGFVWIRSMALSACTGSARTRAV